MLLRYRLFAVLLLSFVTATAAASEWTQTLKKINDSGNFYLGFRVDQTPMSFDRGNGQAAGYSVELCQHIASAVAAKLGRTDLTVYYVPVTAEDRFTSIESGKIDILCGPTTKTLSRAERVGFTQPTFVTGGALLSYKQARIDKVVDLEGKKVAVVSNTTTIETLRKIVDKRKINTVMVSVDSTSEGMKLLEQKQVDAFAADQVVLIGQVISGGGRDHYSLSSELFSFEPFALAIPRGDADFQLVADRALSKLNRSGKIVQIYKKWFGSFGEEPPDMLIALYQLNSTPR